MKTRGIHHITVVTGDLQANLDFYIRVLGLRLVKQTVIQEEPNTYHLFYGDAVGTVGTDMTFFDWPHLGHDRIGARNVIRTLLYVRDQAALESWAARFDIFNVNYTHHTDSLGRNQLHFVDSDNQRLGLVAAGDNRAYQHWAHNPVSESSAIQGIHSVVLGVRQLQPTVDFLTDIFGYQVVQAFQSSHENEANGMILETPESGIGSELVVVERTEKLDGFRAIGSVHHVALTIDPNDSIEAWHERLLKTGLKVTDIVRRYYFDSVYVRIPGGTLFELATAGQALAAGDNPDTIGETLSLPPFLESQRAQIESQLKPITLPQIG